MPPMMMAMTIPTLNGAPEAPFCKAREEESWAEDELVLAEVWAEEDLVVLEDMMGLVCVCGGSTIKKKVQRRSKEVFILIKNASFWTTVLVCTNVATLGGGEYRVSCTPIFTETKVPCIFAGI